LGFFLEGGRIKSISINKFWIHPFKSAVQEGLVFFLKTLKFILRPNVLEEPKEKSGLENCTYKDIKTKLYVM
jgi:hypothetical protein